MTVEYRWTKLYDNVMTLDNCYSFYSNSAHSFNSVSSLNDIESGKIVGEFKDNVFQKALVVPDYSNDYFVEFYYNPVGNLIFQDNSNIFNGNSWSARTLCMTHSGFIALINYFVHNDIFIYNPEVFQINFGKSNLLRETAEELYGIKLYKYVYKYDNMPYKTLKDVLSDELYENVKCSYKKYQIDKQLKDVKSALEEFLKSQTMFDNVNKYKDVLTALNNNL